MMKRLLDIDEKDKEYLGTKAYNCSVLLKKGINSVDGFTLYGNLTEEDFIAGEYAMMDDTLYAVRSSMSGEDGENISAAGKYLSVLSVDKKGLRDAVSEVYEQAGGECMKKAVLVQKLIESELAGVIFTKNPVTGEGMLIDAVFGTGENLVSGSVTPDEFEVIDGEVNASIRTKTAVFTYGKEYKPGSERMLNKTRARTVIHNDGKLLLSIHFEDSLKPVLYTEQILLLTKEAEKIKQIFGCDQDIEFAYANEKFYFLQTRPVTAVIKKHVVVRTGVGEILKGQQVSSGSYTGRTVKISSKGGRKDIKNAVLVVDEFYPEIIYEIEGIGAIITAKGGKLSHAAIVAREKGIPCVTGLEEEIERIKDGVIVLVDADRGEVVLYGEAQDILP